MAPSTLSFSSDREEEARIRREERAKKSPIVRERAFEIYKADTPKCSYEEFRDLEVHNRWMADIYLRIALNGWRARYNKFCNFPIRKRAFENYKRDHPDTHFQGMKDLLNIDHPRTDYYLDTALQEVEAEAYEKKMQRKEELRSKKGVLQKTWYRLSH